MSAPYRDGYNNGRNDTFLGIHLTIPMDCYLNAYGKEYYRGYTHGVAGWWKDHRSTENVQQPTETKTGQE